MTQQVHMHHLPRAWVCTNLDSVCEIIAGYGFPKRLQGKRSGDLPFYKVGDISKAWQSGSTYLTEANHYLNRDEAATINAHELPAGAIVFAKIGAAIALNRRSILSEPSLVDNNVMALSPKPGALTSQFLFYFMCTIKLGDFARATAVPSVRRSDIETISFPLAPLPEQRRIVAEIEKQFTRLDASVAALRRTQANLKRYRASVLRAACSGELVTTEAGLAHAEGRDYEPADVLLERILAERRTRWESKEKRRGKYKEPAAPDTSDLPSLPEGWVWASLEQATEIQGGIQKQPKRAPLENAFPFLRVANVLRGDLDLSEVHRIELFGDELAKLRLVSGDLLIVEGNGSPAQIGRMAVWNGQIEDCVHQNHIIRARAQSGIDSKFVETYWNSPMGSASVLGVASSTSGLYTLSVSKVGGLPVPLPPLAEQRRIVAEVERRLSVIQQTEAAVESSLQRAERLRQSILKRAFSGELVPQDPYDEPASVLLERIRVQREAEQAAASAAKKRPARRRSRQNQDSQD